MIERINEEKNDVNAVKDDFNLSDKVTHVVPDQKAVPLVQQPTDTSTQKTLFCRNKI